MSKLLLGISLFFIGQILIWYQTNGQFRWDWCEKNPFAMALIFSIPISFAFIIATRHVVGYFDGQLWPGRFIGFALGISSYALMTWYFMGEGITLKTLTSLILCTGIICVQVFWK